MSGCLIGPKSWNRRVEIFGEFLRPICAVRSSFRDCFGYFFDDLLNKLCFGE